MFKKKLLCALAVAAFAFTNAGCNSNKDLFEPVESPEVENLFDVEPVWSQSTQGVDKYFSQLNPCISGETLYIAGRKGKVYSLAMRTGEEKWVDRKSVV